MTITGKYIPSTACLVDMETDYPQLNWNYYIGFSDRHILLYFNGIRIINIPDFNFVDSIIKDLYKLRKQNDPTLKIS